MNDNEIESLKNELEHEKTCREAAAWQNGELEKQIVSIQEELRRDDYPWDCDDDLARESNRHKSLLETIEALRDQLPVLREKIKNAKVCGLVPKLVELLGDDHPWKSDHVVRETNRLQDLQKYIEELPDQLPVLPEKTENANVKEVDCKLKHADLNINLDILTPAELMRTVKRFERLKTDLISTLRSKEWRLDSESKLYTRVNDQRSYLQNELLICQNNILRLQKNTPYWQNVPRKKDERILDPKRGPIKKIFAEQLAPIPTK